MALQPGSLADRPESPLAARIDGSTDSELLFFLALTYGLEDDPPRAVERAVGFVEEVGRRHGAEHPIQMTVATTDGARLWAFRYSSEGSSRPLFFSTDVRKLREVHPELALLQAAPVPTDGDRFRLGRAPLRRDRSGRWR